MRRLALSFVAFFLSCAVVFSAEVQIATPKPKGSASPAGTAAPSPTAEVPQYRPVLLGTSPLSVINRIDIGKLVRDGQKDASLRFCCSVKKTGEVVDTWVYSQSPESKPLEEEVFRCLDTAVLIPALYNREPVHVLFFGTVIFKIVDGKPRLRIFANQEAEELKNESNFVGPQPFVGRESKFEGLHYPNDVLTGILSGIVELAMKVDADGNLKELKLVSEHPPLVGFGRSAAEDFRVARFIPAFRDGKPVECSIVLPVYYQP